jgi:hypothetical protein
MKLRTLPAMRNVFVFMILVLTAVQALAGARITSWDDLHPSGDIAFDDPFARLSPDQLWDLRSIVRIHWLIANRKSEPNGVSAKEAQRLVNRLADQGVDVEWLLSQREKVTEARRQKLASVGSVAVGTPSGSAALTTLPGSAPSFVHTAAWLRRPLLSLCLCRANDSITASCLRPLYDGTGT